MIETGTPDQLKESILGNVAWRPTADMLPAVKKAFEAHGMTVTLCLISMREIGKGNSYTVEHTIGVYFTTKRSAEGAMAKALRAVKSLRLAMCHFEQEQQVIDGHDLGKLPSGRRNTLFRDTGSYIRGDAKLIKVTSQFPTNCYQVRIRGYD